MKLLLVLALFSLTFGCKSLEDRRTSVSASATSSFDQENSESQALGITQPNTTTASSEADSNVADTAEDDDVLATTSVAGFDLNGVAKNCEPLAAGTVCTTIYTPADAFGAQCRDSGATATKCDCHDFICSENIVVGTISTEAVTGFDLNGLSQTCTPVPANTICTTIYTPEDAFGMQCRDSGAIVTKCDCHQFICSQNLNSQ